MPVNRLTVGGRNAPWRQLAWFEPERIPVFTPSMQAPLSFDRALRIAGLGLGAFRRTRSLGQDFTDPKIGIPAALLPPRILGRS
jgi:hypothetical protein